MQSWNNSQRHHVWILVVLRFLLWSSVPTSQSFHIQNHHQQHHHHPTKPAIKTRHLHSHRAAISSNILDVSSIDDDSISNKNKNENMPPHDTASTVIMMPPVTTTTPHTLVDQDATVHTGSVTTTTPETTTSVVPERSMTGPTKAPTAILRIYGPDQKGIVAAFAQLLHGHGCNIVDSEQHAVDDIFFQRISFDYSSMLTDRQSIETGIKDVCQRLGMHSDLNWGTRKKRVAILVSKYDHCLWELLLRRNTGDIDCDISVIISNHPDLKHVADTFGIPFEVYKITKATKSEQEDRELDALQNKYQVDLVILARYMQIISSKFCDTFQHRVINIHHSFLPAFVGGKPYHRAHERGVKLVGATAHYATADLDEGPIIEQDIARISHRDVVDDLLRKGRILERNVLVAAVKAHLEDRILVYRNKTVVFGE